MGVVHRGLLPTNQNHVNLPPSPYGNSPEGFAPPVAVIAGPTTVSIGHRVEFRSESYDPNGRIVRTSWGGNSQEIHFTRLGEYILELTAWNERGISDTTRHVITVKNDPPVPIITVSPDRVLNPKDKVTIHMSESYDPDDHAITDFQWQLNGEVVSWGGSRQPELYQSEQI